MTCTFKTRNAANHFSVRGRKLVIAHHPQNGDEEDDISFLIFFCVCVWRKAIYSFNVCYSKEVLMVNLLLSLVIDLAKNQKRVTKCQERTFDLDKLNQAPNQLARLGSSRITKLNGLLS